MVHPDRGGTNAQVHEANAARDLLLDELPHPQLKEPHELTNSIRPSCANTTSAGSSARRWGPTMPGRSAAVSPPCCAARAASTVAVGYDGRVSSPMLEHALIEGLNASGCDVVRIGMGATPMLYYAEASAEDVDGGIQITGSHNPANYNGFKMVFQGRPFFGEDILTIGRLAAEGDWADGTGTVETREILDDYIERLLAGLDGIDAERWPALRVGWDAGNGAAGPALEALVARLPGEHHLLLHRCRWQFSQSSSGPHRGGQSRGPAGAGRGEEPRFRSCF